MDKGQRRFLLDRLGPEAPGPMVEPVSRADMPTTIARIYVKLLRDRAVSPRRQDQMVANLGGADVLTLNAGHDPMISRPQELAALLNAVAAIYW